ncbi:MAG TPA: MerC domain-containing protein [Anditalea sp.]|nr:MerC domain-containing protein [Anditalea sp.]
MLQIIKIISLIKSDLIGISASIACIVHCLVAPALISVGYLFNHTLLGQWHLLDYLFIGIAIAAVYFSTKKNTPLKLKYFFWMMVSTFSASILLHEHFEGLEILTLISSLILIFLHFIRLRLIAAKRKVLKA